MDFWKRQFDLGGNLPGSWFHSAFGLLTAAAVLKRFSRDPTRETIASMRAGRNIRPTRRRFERMSVTGVRNMLLAMATECLLKALWLKSGGTLAKDGRYTGILRKNEHRLNQLAKAVSGRSGINFTQRELALLEQASYWITSGRYPIQRQHGYLVPFERPDGSIAPAQFWHGDAVRELTALIKKLRKALRIRFMFDQ